MSDIRIRGIAAAPGIATGPAFVYRVGHDAPPTRVLSPEETVEGECWRLDAALAAVRDDLLNLKKASPGSVGSALSKIFDAQVMIVDDPAIRAQVKNTIESKRLAAESAFDQVVGDAQRAIERAPDPYLREMANDIEAVKTRVIVRLMGGGDSASQHLSSPSIILANTITPADIMSLHKGLVLGIVTQTGGTTSHTALLAKSLGIPAVAGSSVDLRTIRQGTQIVVDGFSGTVILNPQPNTVEFFERKRRRAHSPWPKRLDALRELPARTVDRHTITLMANIDLAGEAAFAISAGAAGVGLYRTEYLFLQKGGYPSESRQLEVYRQAIGALRGRPLIVRTFDLGSDKAAPNSPPEGNPALGVRGIRLSLERPSTLQTQFRSLLAASASGPVWVMVPMITSVEEFENVQRIWKDAANTLKKRNTPFDRKTKLGIMIETPAAVQLATELAERADFFSLGTNDLVQYTTAVDRGNQRLHTMHHYWHPSLWRQLHSVVKEGHRQKISVGICGEMSGDPLAVLPLVGVGFDSLSFHPNSIPRIKALIRAVSYRECRKLAAQIVAAATSKKAHDLAAALQERVARKAKV